MLDRDALPCCPFCCGPAAMEPSKPEAWLVPQLCVVVGDQARAEELFAEGNDVIPLYRAPLAPLSAREATEGGEAAAWLVQQQLHDGTPVLRLPLLPSREDMERYQKANPDVVLVPLYTHPSPSKPEGEPTAQVVTEEMVQKASETVVRKGDRRAALFAWLKQLGMTYRERNDAVRAVLTTTLRSASIPPSGVTVPDWPAPTIVNPDIAQITGVPYVNDLLHRLMDAQQDLNLAANESMSQPIADASTLLDEVEGALRKYADFEARIRSALTTVPAGVAEARAEEPDLCPICAVPFKPGDMCLTDITEGACHAECLEDSPMVDLETGEPLPEGAPAPVPYRYDSLFPTLSKEAE